MLPSPGGDWNAMDISQGWLLYVRWQSGQRETIRCTRPDEVMRRGGFWVLACMPVPTVTVVQRQ